MKSNFVLINAFLRDGFALRSSAEGISIIHINKGMKFGTLENRTYYVQKDEDPGWFCVAEMKLYSKFKTERGKYYSLDGYVGDELFLTKGGQE